MNLEKIYRKDVEAKIRASAKKKTVSAGDYNVKGRVSIVTAINNKNLFEIVKLLTDEFQKAAEEFGVDIHNVYVESGGHASGLTARRLETDEEFEERIQRETDQRVYMLREDKKTLARKKERKRREIENLKKQLKELENDSK